MQVTINISGLDQATSHLGQLQQLSVQTFLHDAAEQLSGMLKAAVVSQAPQRSGFLAGSIDADVNGSTIVVSANAFYAPFVLHGTGPHDIFPVSAKALFWPGARHPVRHVHHPGTKANPFGERAVAAVLPAMAAELGRLAETWVRQVAV